MEHIKKFNENNEYGNPGIKEKNKDKVVNMFISKLEGSETLDHYLCVETQKGKKYYIKATRFSPFDFRNDDLND